MLEGKKPSSNCFKIWWRQNSQLPVKNNASIGHRCSVCGLSLTRLLCTEFGPKALNKCLILPLMLVSKRALGCLAIQTVQECPWGFRPQVAIPLVTRILQQAPGTEPKGVNTPGERGGLAQTRPDSREGSCNQDDCRRRETGVSGSILLFAMTELFGILEGRCPKPNPQPPKP